MVLHVFSLKIALSLQNDRSSLQLVTMRRGVTRLDDARGKKQV